MNYNKSSTARTDRVKAMDERENVIYPRPQKELVCVMENAEEEGHLLETILEEFAEHPFSMPALWACRGYFHQLDMEDCNSHPALLPMLALLSAMGGRPG